MSALPIAAPLDIKAASSANSIAIGFVKNPDESFECVGPLVADIEKFFGLNLIDELTFFGPTGKAGEIFEIPVSATDSPTDRIFLVGIGDQSGSALRAAGASVGRKVRGKNLTIYSACAVKEIKAHAISMALGAWVWNLKTDKKKEEPRLLIGSKDTKNVDNAAAIAQAICRARDLIHTPANIKTPAWMGKQAELFAKGTSLKVKIYAGNELKEFGGLRAVGGSSPKPGPRMIEVSYQPKSKKKSIDALPHVVLVGKGITFDTGGVSLKRPYDTMMAMKSDMAGSAAILATLTALEDLQPNVRVTALMMMAENAISGTAQRPSDVIKHYGGTTVEVINTDAEGRLVLADGLAYADLNLDPDYLVDIATLTGAATLGLGRQYAAMYTRDHALAAQISKAGETTGDRVWHMPLVDDYKDSLVSDIADFNHNASKGKYSAGSVTAALFLENFVGARRWVHLDIAGTARSEVDAGENSKGGTGFGVRLLTEWITSL
ncbi:MAG: leucyl aminopeptidase family protein [Actinomycetes bacterium]